MTNYLKSASISWSAFLFFLICSSNSLQAQQTEQKFKAAQDSLLIYFKNMQQNIADAEKANAANDKILSALEKFLKEKDAFDFRFQLDKNLSDLVSDDKTVRIISWVTPPQNGIYKCFGFVLRKNTKTKTVSVFKLKEKPEKVENIEKKAVDKNNWQGCVYYNLIEKTNKRKTYYTLIGWNGNDGITQKKIIDVLTFSSKGEPVFGAAIFMMRKQKWNRVIFEYSPQAVMQLNYDEQKRMILFDHLAPNDPVNTGRFQYYGPDFSVDGLRYKKGIWILEEDVNAKNND